MIDKYPLLKGSLVLGGCLLVLAMLLNASKSSISGMGLDDVLGVVYVEGVIDDVSAQDVVRQIDKMMEVEHVKGVILRINSPGGGVASAHQVYEKVRQLNEKKPVYASMGTVAASGGYYVAMGAKKVYANPGCITGSIGVLLQWVNFEGLSEKIGVRPESVKAGKNKDLISPFRTLNLEDRSLLEEMVNQTHEQFIQIVIENRKQLDQEKIRELSDGRIFNGLQAQQEGMVDALKTLEAVSRTMAEDLGLDYPVELVDFKRSPEDELPFFLRGWFSGAFKSLMDNPVPNSYIPRYGVRLSYLLQ